MRFFHSIAVGLLLVASCPALRAQQRAAPFENEIQAFETQDRTTSPPKNALLFTGSSSIRLWPNLKETFPNKPVLQRGFGGSQLSDVIHFADRVIVNYKPKQILVYAGENDIASGQSAQQVYDRFVTLFTHVRKALPKTPFVFISIKPSPSRRQYQSAVVEANRRIKAYLAKKRRTTFVDVYSSMLDARGAMRGELFKADSLHMNAKGYEIWTQKIRPVLK